MVPVAFVVLVSAAFVALVPVAVCGACVRKDAYDHAIWTVVVVSHPVVPHWNWFQLRFRVIVVVIACAIHVKLLLFLSHQQMEELWAILVVVQANLVVQEAQEAPEVCREDQEEQSWSHLLLRYRV